MSERWYPPSRPRAVEGGLKARTARGAIGATWWSRRFLDALESIAMGSRLARGRSYARKGQVVSLGVTPGEVRASVQGSRARPYKVSIKLAPFTELVWAKAEIALSEQALPSAKLLAGEVPPELEQVFADAGAPLFPQHIHDLDQQCSCPDWEVPCKHLAATFYLLAEAFDADPFLMLRWRGRDREQLLARLRELRASEGVAEPTEAGGAPVAFGTELALAGLAGLAGADADQVDDEIDRFWLPPPPTGPRPPVLAVEPDLLLRQLSAPSAVLGGEALVARLRPLYQQLADFLPGPGPSSGAPT
jgi:uncharacterized Zn finger protein